MAPTSSPSTDIVRTVARTIHTILKSRELPWNPTLPSCFALILAGTPQVDTKIYDISSIQRRQSSQQFILAIPTTYAGLNDGPAPGLVAGIMFGAIGGSILVLYVVLSLFGYNYWAPLAPTLVREEEVEVIRHSTHRRRRSQPMSEVRRPASQRVSSRIIDETIIVEEHNSGGGSAIEVEEFEEDVVEVIEENSPEPSAPSVRSASVDRRRRSKPKRESGFRIVDPGEPGGGSAPRRKISRR